MKRSFFILVLIAVPAIVSAQKIILKDSSGVISNSLVLGDGGTATTPSPINGEIDITKLQFPIGIYTAGYKSIQVSSRQGLKDTISLQRLSDSLDPVLLVSKPISDRESLFKIIQNTKNKLSSQNVKFNHFYYLLIGSEQDTMALAKGIVSRQKQGEKQEKIWPYFEQISTLKLDTSKKGLLSDMWPAPFLMVYQNNLIMKLEENLLEKRRNADITLDSIVPDKEKLRYFLKAIITYDHLFGEDHVMNISFSAEGTNLNTAYLDQAEISYPINSKGLSARINISYQFSPLTGRINYESFLISYRQDDSKCPGCKELLVLKSYFSDKEPNPYRQRTGYKNLWQSLKSFKRESIFNQIVKMK